MDATVISKNGIRPSLSWSDVAFIRMKKWAQNVPSEDSDQTARTRRLIWIFTGHTCPMVHFQTLWLTGLSVFLLLLFFFFFVFFCCCFFFVFLVFFFFCCCCLFVFLVVRGGGEGFAVVTTCYNDLFLIIGLFFCLNLSNNIASLLCKPIYGRYREFCRADNGPI